MPTYSYAKCLENAYKVSWRIEDVLGDHQFDPSRRWLPARLSGADAIECLNEDEKTKLTHVEMASYAHIFGFVEEFIAPTMVGLARDVAHENRDAFHALTNFAAEEVKHIKLFREVRSRVDKMMGFPMRLLANEKEVARAVMSKNRGANLLLTAAIEWFTQLHYLSSFQRDDNLDPFTKEIFRRHWQEESQHAQIDHLEVVRAFGGMHQEEREEAMQDLIRLVAAVDGLLQQQADNDLENLEQYLGRSFSSSERESAVRSVLAAKRYTFIESGLTHPNFQDAFGAVMTKPQQDRVLEALAALLSA